jgi:uncharacterized membrane protein
VRTAKDLRSKTFCLAAVTVICNVLGNFALSQGMHQSDPILNLWMVSGVLLLAVFMISQLSLLSCADLSYVLPITAASYVLTALLGAVALGEYVSTAHWIGISMIFLGVTVVGRTSPRTVPVESESRQ